jgi:DNA polymerase-3 subunit epsilon
VAEEVAPAEAPSLEALARQLEASPDYRVLRRLVPTLQWPGAEDLAREDIARVLVLDTETTGLDHSSCRIMELALLRVDINRRTGQPVGAVQVYDGLEDPGQPIPPEVQKITGIDSSMVAGQKLDEALIATMLDGVDLVVAHNAGFDRPFVEARLPAFTDKDWACSFADIDWKKLGHGSSKLESLALANGWFYDAHRAETDCHALLAVLQADLPAEAQPADTADASVPLNGLALLLAAASQLRYRLQATGAPFDAKDTLRVRGYRWDAAAKVWHTRLGSAAELDAECEWLKVNVYRRSAQVTVETLDARVRYANRPGVVATRML